MSQVELGQMTALVIAGQESATDQLYNWFSEIVALDPEKESSDTPLESGLALSPALAAACLKDPVCVSVFLRGIEAAIREAQHRFPNERIEILYAGTGPFAPLAIPLMTRFTHREVRFTMLDIHRRSIDAVRTLVAHFGFDAFTRDCVVADATSYVWPSDIPLHIVMGEAMQKALAKEPHVAIVRNLVRYLEPNGILIPEHITVDVVLANPETPAERVHLAGLMDLNVESAKAPLDLPVIVEVPEVPKGYALAYITHLTVFGDHALGEYDSGLTHPEFLWQHVPVAGQKLAFRYVTGRKPGFVVSPVAVCGT